MAAQMHNEYGSDIHDQLWPGVISMMPPLVRYSIFHGKWRTQRDDYWVDRQGAKLEQRFIGRVDISGYDP